MKSCSYLCNKCFEFSWGSETGICHRTTYDDSNLPDDVKVTDYGFLKRYDFKDENNGFAEMMSNAPTCTGELIKTPQVVFDSVRACHHDETERIGQAWYLNRFGAEWKRHWVEDQLTIENGVEW